MNGRTRFVGRWVFLAALTAALAAAPTAAWSQEKQESPYIGPASAFKDKKTIAEKLETDVDVVLAETSLKDVAKTLQKALGLSVVLNARSLDEAAVSVDTPITIELEGMRLRSALKLIFDDLDLTYVENDQYLAITTFEDAESQLEARVYDVRELLALPTPVRKPAAPPVEDVIEPKSGVGAAGAPGAIVPRGIAPQFGGGGGLGGMAVDTPPSDADELVNLITTTIFSQSWDSVGGPGTIVEYKGLVVISQTTHCHQAVEHLLNMLHEAAGLPGKKVKVTR